MADSRQITTKASNDSMAALIGKIFAREADLESLKKQVDESGGGASATVTDVTIAADSWTDGGGHYYADAAIDGVTASTAISACVAPGSRAAAVSAGLVSMCESIDGAARFYAEYAPTADMGIQVTLVNASGGAGDNG